MDEKRILEMIIENNGECCRIVDCSDMCAKCPLSKLLKRSNGDRWSCWETVVGPDAMHASCSEINKLYMNAAEEMLLDMQIEEELTCE